MKSNDDRLALRLGYLGLAASCFNQITFVLFALPLAMVLSDSYSALLNRMFFVWMPLIAIALGVFSILKKFNRPAGVAIILGAFWLFLTWQISLLPDR